jgi:hypothetical protein
MIKHFIHEGENVYLPMRHLYAVRADHKEKLIILEAVCGEFTIEFDTYEEFTKELDRTVKAFSAYHDREENE